MQLLGALFEARAAGTRRGELNVPGCDLRDTASAAEYALRGRAGINVFMLSPQGPHERLPACADVLVAGREHPNWRSAGTFDDCQDLVKAVVRRSRVQEALARRQRQFDQLGVASSRRLSTTSAAISRRPPAGGRAVVLRGSVRKFRQHPVGLDCPQHGPADRTELVAGHSTKTTSRRILPHRPLLQCAAAARRMPQQSVKWTSAKASNFERYIYDVVGRNARGSASFVVGDRYAAAKYHVGGERRDLLSGAAQLPVSGRSTHVDRLARSGHRTALWRRHRSAYRTALKRARASDATPMICSRPHCPPSSPTHRSRRLLRAAEAGGVRRHRVAARSASRRWTSHLQRSIELHRYPWRLDA